MDMTEDSEGQKWLAMGCSQSNEVLLYLYDESIGSFPQLPHTVVGSATDNTRWKGDLGSNLQFHDERVLIGAPTSNFLGAKIGAVLQFQVRD